MQQIVCKKCGYVWQYAGSKRRISCSKCKTSITIHTPQQQEKPKLILSKEEKATRQIPDKPSNEIVEVPKLKGVFFPLSLWRDVRLQQRIDHAPSLGEDHIVLKVDKDGILSLG